MADLQHPANDLPTAYWKAANPQDVLQFSAVAYFFGKALFEKYHVPIGIINVSVGGTPIESWTSEEGLEGFPSIKKVIERNNDTAYVNETNRKAAAVNASRPPIDVQDRGLIGDHPWFDTTYVPKEWHRISIPGYWDDQGIKDLNGVVWYRREIEIPAAMNGVPVTVSIGRIVDADFVYVNGQLVGTTSYQYPQRYYNLGAGVVKPGKNLIVIRVVNYSGKGGFVPDKPYYIFGGKDTVNLTGYWQYKVGEAFVPSDLKEEGMVAQNQPTSLFNAMIAPSTNCMIKGILWYQGESNSGNATEYRSLLPALINDWMV